MTVINSTISRNNANTNGGGILTYRWHCQRLQHEDRLQRRGCGRAIPTAAVGEACTTHPGATFNLRNTLVAGNNVANAPIHDDCTGTLNSYGRNLFWELTGCTVNTDQWKLGLLNGSSLGPLQNNGGPTWTHALLPGSNAIDGGDPVRGCIGPNSFPLVKDQRGAERVVGIRCDIGAFEYARQLPWLYLRR